jgi:hypothetical protein
MLDFGALSFIFLKRSIFQIYSLIFIFCAPITAALMPIVLFAILHSASFTLTLLDQVEKI